MHTMTPWAERWEAAIGRDLIFDSEALEVEFDFSNLMRGDVASRSAYYQSGIQNGWLTRNEARAAENLNPIAGLEQPLRPLNMVEESDAQESETESASPASDTASESGSDETANPTDAHMRMRFGALVSSNAHRLARRIHKKGVISVNDISLIADALGLSQESVKQWAKNCDPIPEETTLRKLLIRLGTTL